MTNKVFLPGETRAKPDFQNRRVVCFGHSYMAADPQNTVGYRYVEQMRVRLQASRFDNYAIGGRTMEAVYGIADLAWNHDRDAIVIMDAMLNTMRVEGTSAGAPPTNGANADATQMEKFRKDLTRFLDLVRDAYLVLCMEQPYLPQSDYDYFAAPPFNVPMSDAIIDTYNGVVAAEAAKRDNVFIVPLNSRGVRPTTMTIERHNTDAGMTFAAWQIDERLGILTAPPKLVGPIASPKDLPWLALYWADDPAWAHPANGAAVAQWDDGSGNGYHATQATAGNRPTFVLANANFNGHSTLHFNGAAVQGLVTPSWGTRYQPNTIVVICKTDTGATMNLIDGLDANHRHQMRKIGVQTRRIAANINRDATRTVTASVTTGSNRLLAAAGTFTPEDGDKSTNGTGLPGGATAIATYVNSGEMTLSVNATATSTGIYTLGFRDKNIPVMWTAIFNDDFSSFEINGDLKASGDVNNTTLVHALTGINIGRGSDASSPMFGDIAMIGVLPAKMSLEELYWLETWAAAYYALPIVPVVPPVIAPVDPPDIPGSLVGLPFHTSLFAGGSWAHPADGQAMDIWPDSSGNAHNATQLTPINKPIYQVSGLNGRQCVRFDDSKFMSTDLFAVVPQPYTFVVVGFNDDIGTGTFIDGGTGSQRGLIKQVGGALGTGYWRLYGGLILDSAPGTADYIPHLFVGVLNGAASYLEVDGARIFTGNAGTDPLQGLTIGAGYLGVGDFLTGGVGFAGLIASVITPADNTTLKAWVTSEYGIPMAV